jgi:hypothetical protein
VHAINIRTFKPASLHKEDQRNIAVWFPSQSARYKEIPRDGTSMSDAMQSFAAKNDQKAPQIVDEVMKTRRYFLSLSTSS